MSQWRGQLEFHDIGTGSWILVTEAEKIALYGSIERSLDGRMVAVTGDLIEDGVGFAMMGTKMVSVERISSID